MFAQHRVSFSISSTWELWYVNSAVKPTYKRCFTGSLFLPADKWGALNHIAAPLTQITVHMMICSAVPLHACLPSARQANNVRLHIKTTGSVITFLRVDVLSAGVLLLFLFPSDEQTVWGHRSNLCTAGTVIRVSWFLLLVSLESNVCLPFTAQCDFTFTSASLLTFTDLWTDINSLPEWLSPCINTWFCTWALDYHFKCGKNEVNIKLYSAEIQRNVMRSEVVGAFTVKCVRVFACVWSFSSSNPLRDKLYFLIFYWYGQTDREKKKMKGLKVFVSVCVCL